MYIKKLLQMPNLQLLLPTKKHLNYHMVKNHIKVKVKCETCDSIFINITKMEKHIKKYHVKDKYQCNNCKKKYSDKECLRNHIYKENKILNQSA